MKFCINCKYCDGGLDDFEGCSIYYCALPQNLSMIDGQSDVLCKTMREAHTDGCGIDNPKYWEKKK